ncbi:MAG: cytochrome c3 family protein [Myxococcales bacterium]
MMRVIKWGASAAAAVASGLFFAAALAKDEGKARPGSCGGCHAELHDLLPEAHPALKGKDLAGCVSCHKPSGEAKADGFATAMHASHLKALECAFCHPLGKRRAFGVAGTKLRLGTQSPEDAELQGAALKTWAAGSFTAAAHGRAKVACRGCHGADFPVLGSTVENDRCIFCHPLEKLQEKSGAALEFKDRNPHKSHLGELACTTCHHFHAASEVYCLGCHPKFQMVIPGGAPRPDAPTGEARKAAPAQAAPAPADAPAPLPADADTPKGGRPPGGDRERPR